MPSLMKEGQTTTPPPVCEDDLTAVMGFGPNCRREPRVHMLLQLLEGGRLLQLYEHFLIPAKPETCIGEGRVAEMCDSSELR